MEHYKNQVKSTQLSAFSFPAPNNREIDSSTLLGFKEQLNKNGILIFDFWHKQGVLSQKLELKIQRYRAESHQITKLVEPKMDTS